jgi:penicillin-binding protein 1C
MRIVKKYKKILKWVLLVSSAAILLAAASALATFAFILNDLPNPEQFESRQVAQSTKIYDRTGEILLYEVYGEEKRTAVPFSEIPEHVKQATIAIEDKDFYTHSGFDVLSIINGAIIEPLTGQRERARGGSTITQQLAKNAFLSPERTLIRKLKELVVASELEKRYSKDEILNLYLNQVPYGGNAYGIEAASKTFFGKSAKELNLAESALLASLPQATSYYSPWGKRVDELMARKNIVLDKMQELGYITEEEKDSAKNFKFSFAPQATTIKAPHFTLEVQEYLIKKYGEDFVRKAGLSVITTLDWNLQQAAEKSVNEGASRNTELYKGHNAALVAQDANSGQILVMVGSKSYFGDSEPAGCTPGLNCRFEGNFNVATQGLRQPGSAMKPFGYITAFQKGYAPETILFDVPTEFAANNPNCPLEVNFLNENKSCFHPQNFDLRFRGPVSLRTALAQSINVPAVKTLYLAGIDDTLKTAADFGISTLTERSRYGLSLVLGGGEITLKELVGAYSVFAEEGAKHRQSIILKITDSKGNVLEEYKDSVNQVMDPQYTRMINDILTDIEERSGLFSSSLPLTIFPGHQVALKTGTTNDYRDAWAIGYTPDLVVGVWSGNNNNTPMEQRGSSILAAIPIWSSFLKEALAERPLVSFNKPDPVISEKPIIRGESVTNYKVGDQIYPQIHNILYFVDKRNPSGPYPANPENDPQFQNWELPVLRWAEQNIFNFSSAYNHPLPPGAQVDAGLIDFNSTIEILSPKNGDFIKNDNIFFQARISTKSPLKSIQLFFNEELVDQRLFDQNYISSAEMEYQFNLIPRKIELQNSIKLKVSDSSDNQVTKEVIVYR